MVKGVSGDNRCSWRAGTRSVDQGGGEGERDGEEGVGRELVEGNEEEVRHQHHGDARHKGQDARHAGQDVVPLDGQVGGVDEQHGGEQVGEEGEEAERHGHREEGVGAVGRRMV